MTTCATISRRGFLLCYAMLGPYNTMNLLAFHHQVYQLDQREPAQPQQPGTIFVPTGEVHDWLTNNPKFSNISIPAYSPYLNPIEEFCQHGCGRPMTKTPTSCSSPPGHWEGLFRYYGWSLTGVDKAYKAFFPLHCLTRANIAWHVDENLWPSPDQRNDADVE